MDEKQKMRDKLINFFSDKIFIYALVAAIIVTYFYIDYKRYGYSFYKFFIHGAQIELFIPSVIWIICLVVERISIIHNGKKIFKFATVYSVLMTLTSIIIDFTIYSQNTKDLQNIMHYFSWLIAIGIRTTIIYVWVVFINMICRMLATSFKFTFKKQ